MQVEQTIEKITNHLKSVQGIEAIVLGGSRARGKFTAKSDIDIGIYYSDSSQLNLEELSRIATTLDDTHRSNLITSIGEWGPWINGGGWITIDGIPTDFLLRDLQKVSTVIDDCLNGKISIDYQPGHPHGFVNAIYAAEVYYCKLLADPHDRVRDLKDKITPYPLSIKKGIIAKFLWEASFFQIIAQKSILRKDPVYASGCFYRIVACLTQVLYALNETYIMNENGAFDNMTTFKMMPKDYRERMESIFSSLNTEPEKIKELIKQISALVQEVESLSKTYLDA